MPPIIHERFDPAEVELQEANLIEASAGTGKTFSVALMALRLVLEKDIPIDKILMVTFTRDAAAEMELRVRAFIREALSAAQGNTAAVDPVIAGLVTRFNNNPVAVRRLQAALVQFDKAAIFTIHGFCARVLSEFSFESFQLFRAQTLEPGEYEELLADAFNQAWREHITTLPPMVLKLFIEYNHTRKKMLDLVKGHLSGKQTFLPADQVDAVNRLEQLIEDIRNREEELKATVEARIDGWALNAPQLKKTGKTYLRPLLEQRNVKVLYQKICTGYIDTGYIKDNIDPDVLAQAAALEQTKSLFKLAINGAFSALAITCSTAVENRLRAVRTAAGQITFDDMITELYKAVCPDPANPGAVRPLATILADRYRAVFIDEFQDTDRQQYEIFSTLFQQPDQGNPHILFYIGDPKQSIYAFRKADLQTYFRAAREVGHIYRMNNNHRSSASYINAMNDLFQPSRFNVFLSDQMEYYPVSTPPNRIKTGGILYKDRLLEPLRIQQCSIKGNIYPGVVRLVRQLLYNPDFRVDTNGTTSTINPGQIGILVRSKRDGRILRKELSKKGIPAITVSDEKIFESPVAKELLYILEAVTNNTTGNINRALVTTLSGFSWEDLLSLDQDELLVHFRSFQEEWKNKGVYVFLRQYLRDIQAIRRKVQGRMVNGDRVLADTFQLMEMLHEAEVEKQYDPVELIHWLKKGIEGEFSTEDQYLQRIESDDRCVKIVTIHSAKGLEYDIVIAPFLDLVINDKWDTVQFCRDNNYFTADKLLLDPDLRALSQLQEQQENMRLLYVAITRARYHCYLFSAANASDDSSLNRLLTNLINSKKAADDIRIYSADDVDISGSCLFEAAPPELTALPVNTRPATAEGEEEQAAVLPKITLRDQHWQRTSYSKLTVPHDPVPRVQTMTGPDPYDQFIFHTVRKGAQSGNLLHDLLERIDFSNAAKWPVVFKRVLKNYPGTGVKEEMDDLVYKLLDQVTGTELPGGGFSLNTVTRNNRLSEFEFDMPLADVQFNRFPELVEGRIPIRINREKPITGILNGKIDLFFEQGGKYYLLDWKSNHLGNAAEDYSLPAMEAAMEANNYYLQYYLYCLALYRYLRNRVAGFDYKQQFGGVYYLFLRGIRTGQTTGIYYHLPKEEDLLLLEEILLASQPVTI